MKDCELQRLQNITTNFRLERMREKCAQAWLDNQEGATIPIFMDNDFKSTFKIFVTDAIENNNFWETWENLQTI